MERDDPDKSPPADAGQLEESGQEDFAALFEASQLQRDKRTQRDARIEGTIVSVGEEWAFVDIGGKSEGAIAREELLDSEGQLTVGVGDRITAYVVNMQGGEILLSSKMTSAASEEAVRGAFHSGIPVEGLVVEERKGGYSVTIFGRPAFCPFSQIDLQPIGAPSEYVGRRFAFRIIEYGERGRNIVLSRRGLLEEERAKLAAALKQTLRVGDVITGRVQKLAPFGAFVDIGGIEGLIPMSEMAWYRVSEPSDVLTVGEEVTVKVLDLDWDNRRISLSRKQMLDDPWKTVEQRYPVETMLSGTVMKLMNFGAFVELEPGVEGLVHISNMGAGRRINHPRDVLSEGDRVEVKIISVDSAARRIGLEIVPSESLEAGEPAHELRPGEVVAGTVEAVKEYGVFVALPGGKTGLLHLSEIGGAKSVDLRNRFSLGSSLEVEILAIDSATGKIALSTKTVSQRAEQSQYQDFAGEKGGKPSFGTLGDILRDKLKK